jgi:serine/threonine-protein kinase HipA
MKIRALAISIGDLAVGTLFQYGDFDNAPITRFVADDDFIRMQDPPLLSLSMLADDPQAQRALWVNIGSPAFNGRSSARNGWLLPGFFQNLLPEGVFRDHIASLRGCSPLDHFEILGACGRDLPGNVYALPVELDRTQIARLVTQNADALEMSVIDEPMEQGVSVSGVQPKLGVIKDGERYVGRTRMHDTHIIAKLPVVGTPQLPELEELSLRLAAQAGVNACHAILEPLEKLVAEHHYDLGDADGKTRFLAVQRFDRAAGGRIHCEDFAQVLDVPPEEKYTRSYLDIAAVMLAYPALGEAAVHQLLRRIVVNEMLGNPDMHLKNIGLIYRDGRTPSLSPAYDIVGYAAYNTRAGHALQIIPRDLQLVMKLVKSAENAAKPSLSPAVLRAFCSVLGIVELPARAAVKDAVEQAAKHWPAMIQDAALTALQKKRLLAHIESHSMVAGLRKRQSGRTRMEPGVGSA